MLAESDEKLLVALAGEEMQDMSVRDHNADQPGIGTGDMECFLRRSDAGIDGGDSREARQLARGATFSDGHYCQIALDALRQSSRERRWVAL